jgi:secreted trypsin-like serine protease
MKNLLNNKTVHLLYLLSLMLVFSFFQIKNVNAEQTTNNPEIEAKIIGGNKSGSDDWPWMARLTLTNSSWESFNCGGTLVAPEWVLTAAHCVEGMSYVDVLLGQNDLQGSGGENISADQVFIHPDRDTQTKYADLALIHLETPSSIAPVLLASNFDFQQEEGNSVMAIGWGVTYQGILEDTRTTDLQEVQLTLEKNSTCYRPNILVDNVICLGVFDEKATCSGDSGGPLMIFNSVNQRWEQIGITSFGLISCTASFGIDVFTQVDKYMGFIDTVTNSTEESPERLLAKCVKKFPQYLGEKQGTAFSCGNFEVCQNTTGGELINIRQISVLRDNKDEILEYLDMGTQQWYKIPLSALGYCE